MSTLNLNFDEIPDRQEPIGTGIRNLRVDGVPELKPNKNGDGTNLVVQLRVDEEGNSDHDRQMTLYLSTKAPIRIKKFVRACGIEAKGTGLDLAELAGRSCKAAVTPRTYTDNDTKETVETSQIKDFIIPGE